jgi:benzoylformate decarboxylase
MRQAVHQYLESGLSRRGFLRSLTAMGVTATSARSVLASLEATNGELEPADVPDSFVVEGTGGDLIIAQAKAAGTRFLFTNPGSLETGFFDAFSDSGMQIITGLHEGVVISMADGYNRVSQKPSFVNVHVMPGTAQSAGQLLNAARDGSAIVMTAGLNDTERWGEDLPLAPRPGFNQKEVPRQFTKISWEVREAESLAVMTRRAFKVASTEPGGPVYMAMTNFALQKAGVRGVVLPAERFLLRTRIRGDADAIEGAARRLVEAKRPVVIAGDEVWKSGAQGELLELVEKLGLAVAMGSQAFSNFPSHHPHNVGRFRSDQGFDLVVFAGARDLGSSRIPEDLTIPASTPVVRIGIDTDAMSQTLATDIAIVADVKEGLRDVLDAVEGLATRERLTALARERSDAVLTITANARAEAEEQAWNNLGKSPIHPDELGWAMANTLVPDTILVHENYTGRNDSMRFGFRDDEMMFMRASGGSLGWGVGAATGAKLAAPDRPVVCSIGDGALMYSSCGFWTQARFGVPVLTVVWNNHNYQIVRHAFHRYQRKMAKTGHYPGMYLGDPDIDFVGLAKSQGVSGERVDRGTDLEAALKRGLAATREGSPYLIDVNVARYGGGSESTWYQKFNLASERARKV